MKKIITFFVLLFFALTVKAQTDGITYQAVIIDNNPEEIPGVDIPANNLPNMPLTVRFSILDSGNAIEYQETHETNTDSYGMINLMIGQGSETSESSGAFSAIYWNNVKFLRVEIDLFDGNGLVEFSFQELTYIPYVKHRELIADGVTNLNSSLTVNNQSPTLLTGDLTVEGLVAFDGELEIGGDTQIYADLTVSGDTNLGGTLDVIGQATFNDSDFQNITVAQTTDLNGTLDVAGTSTLNNTLTVEAISNLNGRVIIDANMDAVGGDLFSAAHPLRVQGSRQGISIELTGNAGGTPNSGNNFLSFTGANNIRYGRIEGQTATELHNSFPWVFDQVHEGLQYGFQLAMIVVDLIGIDDADAAAVEGFEMVEIIEYWAGRNIHRENNLGVAFESGFGDYAEWLEKEKTNEIFSYGDIVGVKGGKISKDTESADHYMVISQNPIVLGNMPNQNRELDYEKVAFMGQVPVKIMGKVAKGDYIIPSNLNDGIGRAVSPRSLKISDFNKVVGVAWSTSESKGISMVNLAVGINMNDTAHIIKKQQEEVNALKKQLNGIINYLTSKDTSFKPQGQLVIQDIEERSRDKESLKEAAVAQSKKIASTKETKKLDLPRKTSDRMEKILQLLEEKPGVLDQIMEDARAYLDAQGVNYKAFEQTNKVVNDKNYLINYLRELSN